MDFCESKININICIKSLQQRDRHVNYLVYEWQEFTPLESPEDSIR